MHANQHCKACPASHVVSHRVCSIASVRSISPVCWLLTCLNSQAMAEGQSIIIDCDFEEQMTETEIKSLCGQLQYCYASNVRASKPCHLSFTSLKVSSILTLWSYQEQCFPTGLYCTDVIASHIGSGQSMGEGANARPYFFCASV